MSNYFIWSNENRGWWKPDRMGYTRLLRYAGAYSREEALQICRDAIYTARMLGHISELPVRCCDVIEFLKNKKLPECIGARNDIILRGSTDETIQG